VFTRVTMGVSIQTRYIEHFRRLSAYYEGVSCEYTSTPYFHHLTSSRPRLLNFGHVLGLSGVSFSHCFRFSVWEPLTFHLMRLSSSVLPPADRGFWWVWDEPNQTRSFFFFGPRLFSCFIDATLTSSTGRKLSRESRPTFVLDSRAIV
jgi:hypothetical protein